MQLHNTPQIGFGHIRHARLRLAAHRFCYAAWFLRLPLRSLSREPTRLRWLKFNRRGIFSVFDIDHGDGQPLLRWIDELLRAEGISDADGEVWLHTFPRLLGFVFNPVSFWFVHRADGSLRATLCEVNNTFGERHFYLLAHPDGRPLRWGEELTARKVFHVSPFCKVEGRYRFRFMLNQPAAETQHPKRFVARIDYDDAGGPLLQTSVAGELVPLTDRALTQALLRYPLFAFSVIARIHWHALRLWLRRLPFIPKPVPPAINVTRASSH
ncbi:MAG: DUF1365 domain-containing protein [Burkholderiaceae bacterium]